MKEISIKQLSTRNCESKSVEIIIKDKISFKFSGDDRENTNLTLTTPSQEILIKLCADSMLELTRQLYKMSESFVSKLNDPSYTPIEVIT